MRGVTLVLTSVDLKLLISTRTPHAGSDTVLAFLYVTFVTFQPALPMRGVTWALTGNYNAQVISTRTPHAGSDAERARHDSHIRYFNPHSPCGE